MKKILVITSTYLPNAGANGILTQSIVDGLKRNHFYVEVLSIKTDVIESDFEIIDDTKIHRVDQSKFTQEYNQSANKIVKNKVVFKRKMKNFFSLFNFPNYDEEHVKKIYNKAIEIMNDKSFQYVIGIGKPFSNIIALQRLSSRFKKVSYTAIFLDPLTSLTKSKFLPGNIYKKLLNKANENFANSFDNIFQPINTKRIYSDKKYTNDFIYFEYPSLNLINYNTSILTEEAADINFLYAGTLDKINRNPDMMFKVITSLSEEDFNMNLNLFGTNDLNSKQLSKYPFQICNHGLVSHDDIIEEYNNSHFLINISNSSINSIPSKIFELFSTGKPILNIVSDESDYTLKYFDMYPLSFNFYTTRDYGTQIENLKFFIEKNLNSRVDKELIKKVFYKNTKSYFINQIISKL